MNRPRVVIAGAGGIAGAWLPGVKAEDVDVIAVVDLQLEAAQRRIDEFELGAKASTDLAAVLEAESPDFVLDF